MPSPDGHISPTTAAELQAMQVGLSGARTVEELLARASVAACRALDFDSALTVTLCGDRLMARATGAIDDPASEALRQRVLRRPVELTADCAEFALLRCPGVLLEDASRPSVLMDALRLQDVALSAIAPRGRMVALIVAEADPVTACHRRSLDVTAHIVGLTLEALLARERLAALTGDLRMVYTSATAVLAEATEYGDIFGVEQLGTVGAAYLDAGEDSGGGSQVERLLIGREPDVVRLMVAGRTNREIAGTLHLAPDTVKWYVARVLRKLGASNRVEAVGRYLELAGGDVNPAA
jgi:DNA-binding CsgD family transcriptional regulator